MLLNTLLTFMLPLLIIFCGLVFSIKFLKIKSITNILICSMIFGTSTVLVPICLSIIFSRAFIGIFVALMLLAVSSILSCCILLRSLNKDTLQRVLQSIIVDHSGKICLIVMTVYIIKTFLILIFRPILDPDFQTIYYRLSYAIAKGYVIDLAIPSLALKLPITYDLGLPMLYSITQVFSSNYPIETYRLMPSIYFIFLPLLVREIAIQMTGSKSVGNYSAIIFASLPIVDVMMYIYPNYPDVFAICCGLASLILCLKLMNGMYEKITAYKISMIIGMGIGLSMLFKVYLGVQFFLLMLFLMLYHSVKGVRKKLGVSLYMLLLALLSIIAQYKWHYSELLWYYTSVGFLLAIITYSMLHNSRTRCENTGLAYTSIHGLALFSFIIIGLCITYLPIEIAYLSKGVSILRSGIFVINNPEIQQVVSIASEIFPKILVPYQNNILPLFFHPFLNRYSCLLTVFSIFIVAFSRKLEKLPLALLSLTFLLYLTISSALPSGRHLFLTAIFLSIVIAYGISHISHELGYAASFYTIITSSFQYVTFNRFVDKLDEQNLLRQFFDQLRIQYAGYYDMSLETCLTSNIILFQACFLILLFLLFMLKFLATSKEFIKINTRFSKRKFMEIIKISLVIMIVIACQLKPFLFYSNAVGGLQNMSTSKDANAYYWSILLGNELASITNGSLVLGFLLSETAYRYFHFVDIKHGGIQLIKDVWNVTNPDEAAMKLYSNGIKFFVVPTADSYYGKELSKYNLILHKILQNSSKVIKLKTIGNGIIYSIKVD